MNLQNALLRFNSALTWNAALYSVYKLFSLSLSIALFATLATNDYALWANINSIIFLFLLWIDCGMRKSVPRFSPEFLFSRRSTIRFIVGISIFQAILLSLCTPLIYLSLSYTARTLGHHAHTVIFFGLLLFVSQGIAAILRLIFHSYFLQKQFNGVAIIIMSIEMLFNIFFFFRSAPTVGLIFTIFTIKLIGDAFLIGISMYLLAKHIPILAKELDVTTKEQKNTQTLTKNFVLHSFLMGCSTFIKSLSERNFLVPFLTHTAGPEMANIFKIANDGALIFYRFILKTIGTADTSLLTYIEIHKRKNELSDAFTKLTSRIAGLCLPLLAIVVLVVVYRPLFFESTFVFHIFTLMTTCYLIEALLSPYERVLEIKRDYMYLAIGYIPYAISIFFITHSNIIALIGMIPFVLAVHCVRLVNSFLFVYLSHRAYGLGFSLGSFNVTSLFSRGVWYVIGFVLILLYLIRLILL
jgi:hypothetical protein